MKKVMLLFLLVTAGSYGIVNAQPDKVSNSDKTNWHKIGETTINFLAERYEIIVLESEKFGYIKFKVMNAPIILVDLTVYYENGKKQNIDVNSLVKEPGESWVIKLNLGVRNLQKVVFSYKTLPNHKDEKAHVELWAFRQGS
ncbi:MAG: hypothetical protein IPJ37_06755 [Bacteroidales bacterium]|nr:hypothetical protein [Bacteroidales bacterium]